MSIPDTQDWKFRSDVTLVGSTITLEIKIVGTTVNLPVDIVAQSIGNIAVDIAAQSLTQLKVDIVAQSVGNIAIDIAAQSVGNLTVDIAAQSVSELSIKIVGSTINVPIDIAAQSIENLKVDIAAQSVTQLKVDIVAQSVGNLKVDIAAQSIGNININISAQSVGISIQSEWQVEMGNLKNLYGTLEDVASGSGGYVINYTVPSGKTLYIYSISVASLARSTTEPSGEAVANLTIGGVGYWRAGISNGKPTVTHNFGAPLKVSGGTTLYIYMYNASDHTVHLTATLTGYEV